MEKGERSIKAIGWVFVLLFAAWALWWLCGDIMYMMAR